MGAERIMDEILFEHDFPFPQLSAMDHLVTAIKHLQDAIRN